MSLVTNVFRRGGSYYFRARVPKRFRAVLERRELWRSLRTGDSSQARQRASDVAQLTQRLWRNIDIMKSKSTGTDLIDKAKGLVKAWVIAELRDDEDLRVSLGSTVHPGVIRRHRQGDEPDVYDEPMSSEDLTDFLALSQADQNARLGADGMLLTEVNAGNLRRGKRFQMLEGAASRFRAGSETIAAKLAGQLLSEAGMDSDPNSRPFIAATRLIMRAQVDLRKAIDARYASNWIPDLDVDPASRHVEPLQTAIQPSAPRNESPLGAPPVSGGELLSKLVHAQALEGISTGRFLPGRGKEYRKAVDLFLHWAGSDLCVDQVTSKMAGDFRSALLGYPTNAKKFPALAGLSFSDTVSYAAGPADMKRISVTTANGNYLTPLRSVFDWAMQTGKISANPFAEVRIKSGHRAPKIERRIFTTAELQSLFSSPVFAGSGAASGEGLYRPGSVLIDDWRFWLPLGSGPIDLMRSI